LPNINGGMVRLSNLMGSLILLEFWFPNCGGCIKASPIINSICTKYSGKNLKVYGIEFTQTDRNRLKNYITKQNILYPTLYKGYDVSKDYGIDAAPSFFLIDKKGIIIYTSVGLNENELIKAINNNI
jgi:thiol-disulfide isomerase/thioredoxin